MKKLTILAALLFLSGVEGRAETFDLDPAHTTVGFKIRHLAITNVNGHFSSFTGTVELDEKDVTKSKVAATISAASIDTGISKRDDNLRSGEFFDVSKYPTITFKSTGVDKAKDGSMKLKGDLTMHGVTKPVALDFEFNGVIEHPYAGRRAGFTASGKVDRNAFGIGKPGNGLGDEVSVTLDVEATARKAPAKEAAKTK